MCELVVWQIQIREWSCWWNTTRTMKPKWIFESSTFVMCTLLHRCTFDWRRISKCENSIQSVMIASTTVNKILTIDDWWIWIHSFAAEFITLNETTRYKISAISIFLYYCSKRPLTGTGRLSLRICGALCQSKWICYLVVDENIV